MLVTTGRMMADESDKLASFVLAADSPILFQMPILWTSVLRCYQFSNETRGFSTWWWLFNEQYHTTVSSTHVGSNVWGFRQGSSGKEDSLAGNIIVYWLLKNMGKPPSELLLRLDTCTESEWKQPISCNFWRRSCRVEAGWVGGESGGVGCGHVCSQCRVKSFYVLLAVKANGKEQASAQAGLKSASYGFCPKSTTLGENPKQIVWRYTVSLY